jgi:HAD superfamily hydrolase (TIGR01509 family)
MIKAVFFDRDGTLTYGDKRKYAELYEYIRRVSKNGSFAGLDGVFMDYFGKTEALMGKCLCQGTPERERAFWVKFYELVFKAQGGDLDNAAEAEKLLDLFPQQRFKLLFPEVREVLEYFRSRACVMGVISDTGPSLRDSIEFLGIGSYFSRYVAAAEHGVYKPDPIVFNAAIRDLGIRPEECLYVDDYEVEAEGAREFGFVSFHLVREPARERRTRWQIADLREMIDFAEELEMAALGHLLDAGGKVTRWPKRKAEKSGVLGYLHAKFATGKDYSEGEVNAILSEWHSFGDHALLRRELFENGLLGRTPDGRRYWIAGKKDNNRE